MIRKVFWIQIFLLVFFISHLSFANTESQNEATGEKAVIESGGGKIEKITPVDIGAELAKSDDG